MNNYNYDTSKIIKAARAITGKNQTEFGELTGLGKTTISNYETGYSTPSWETVGMIADSLNLSMAELIECGSPGADIANLGLPKIRQMTNDKFIPVLSCKALESFDSSYPETKAQSFISLPGSILSGDGNYICVKASDSSMRGDRIKKNDHLFVRLESVASDNDIVVAKNSEDNSIVIRKFSRNGHIIELSPSPITPRSDVIRTHERNNEFKIIGIVEKILTNA